MAPCMKMMVAQSDARDRTRPEHAAGSHDGIRRYLRIGRNGCGPELVQVAGCTLTRGWLRSSVCQHAAVARASSRADAGQAAQMIAALDRRLVRLREPKHRDGQ
jgi:hypothetical protein